MSVNGFVNIHMFVLSIFFQTLRSPWGALLGLSELHFGFQRAPQELSGGFGGDLSGPLRGHHVSTSSWDRDLGALRELLGAPFLPLIFFREASKAPRSGLRSFLGAFVQGFGARDTRLLSSSK